MRRIDRLLIMVQEAERLDSMQVYTAYIERSGDKWRVIVELWDGVEPPKGRTQRLTLDAETEAEALAAVKEVEAAHTPTGYRAKKFGEAAVIIDDI